MAGASGSAAPPTANGAPSRSAVASPKKVASQSQAKANTEGVGSGGSSSRKGKAAATKGKQAAPAGTAAGSDSTGKAAGKAADLRYTPIVQGRASSLPLVFTKDSE